MCHALRWIREGQPVPEIPAARSWVDQRGAWTPSGVPTGHRLPAFLQPHSHWLGGKQWTQQHSYGDRCCALRWRDRRAVKNIHTVITLNVQQTHTCKHECMHTYKLVCKHTIGEFTVNCCVDEFESQCVDNWKCTWTVAMFCSVFGCKAKKQAIDVMGRWNSKRISVKF